MLRAALAILLCAILQTNAAAQEVRSPEDLKKRPHITSGLCILDDGKIFQCDTYGKEGDPNVYFALFDTVGFKTEIVEIKRLDLRTQEQTTVWTRQGI